MTNCENCGKELGTYEFNRSEYGIICDSCSTALKKSKVKEIPKRKKKWTLYPKTTVGKALFWAGFALFAIIITNYGFMIIMVIMSFILYEVLGLPMP